MPLLKETSAAAGCNCGGSHTAAENEVEERAQIKQDFESVASRIKPPSDHSFPHGSRAKQRSTEVEVFVSHLL